MRPGPRRLVGDIADWHVPGCVPINMPPVVVLTHSCSFCAKSKAEYECCCERAVWYCSLECQYKDWEQHKPHHQDAPAVLRAADVEVPGESRWAPALYFHSQDGAIGGTCILRPIFPGYAEYDEPGINRLSIPSFLELLDEDCLAKHIEAHRAHRVTESFAIVWGTDIMGTFQKQPGRVFGPQLPQCDRCLVTPARLRCSCDNKWYCSLTCQAKDWEVHSASHVGKQYVHTFPSDTRILTIPPTLEYIPFTGERGSTCWFRPLLPDKPGFSENEPGVYTIPLGKFGQFYDNFDRQGLREHFSVIQGEDVASTSVIIWTRTAPSKRLTALGKYAQTVVLGPRIQAQGSH